MEKKYLGSKSRVKRIPERGHYDEQTLFRILDEGRVCHLGFCIDSHPFVIPTLYGRDGETIYVHGASTSRMLTQLEMEVPVCMTVTHLDGLVLARSAFHHSMNYRSAVIFAQAEKVEEENEKIHALKVISDQVLKGRWEEVRSPNAKELKATSVLKLYIKEASSKIRMGPPGDEKEDLELGIWAGVIPIKRQYGTPEADEFVNNEEVPESVDMLMR